MEEADEEKRETPDVGRQMELAGKLLTKDFVLVILKGKELQGCLSLVCCTYFIVFCGSLTPMPQVVGLWQSPLNKHIIFLWLWVTF